MISDFISNSDLINDEELIFFGGSFNPWHEGHASCIKLMPKDKKIVVIADHSPFKELTSKLSSLNEIQNELDRIDRTTLLFGEFFDANKKNPTYNWIEELHSKFPDKKLSLLMGFDSFASIDKWTKSTKLLNTLSTLYVAGRLDDKKVKEKQIQSLLNINPNLELSFLGGHPHEEISSTKIRKERP
jgi:nicotinate-nucleotide adenylyltransferase